MPTIGFMGALTIVMRVLVLLFSRVDEPTPSMSRVILLLKIASGVALAATVLQALHLLLPFSGTGSTTTSP